MSEPVIAGFTAIFVLMTVLPLSRSSRWWIRGLDFPRLQIAAAGLLLLAAQLSFLDLSEFPEQLMPVATAACLLYQAWWILPYLRPYPNEVRLTPAPADTDRVRILSSNVLMTNRNADALIALVRQHRARHLGHAGNRRLVAEPARCAGKRLSAHHQVPAGQYLRHACLFKAAARGCRSPVPGAAGCAIDARNGDPAFGPAGAHAFLHPAPPSPTENDESTERDAELLVVAKSVVKVLAR